MLDLRERVGRGVNVCSNRLEGKEELDTKSGAKALFKSAFWTIVIVAIAVPRAASTGGR